MNANLAHAFAGYFVGMGQKWTGENKPCRKSKHAKKTPHVASVRNSHISNLHFESLRAARQAPLTQTLKNQKTLAASSLRRTTEGSR